MYLCLSTLVGLTVGSAIWMRRRSWRSYSWQQILSIAVVLLGAGYALCMPMQHCIVNDAIYQLTGVCHVREYLGHLCFLAATCCVICTVAYRLLPRKRMEDFMIRIEVPAAAASALMLVCLIASRSTKTLGTADFLDAPLDGWLTTYWLVFAAAAIYLGSYVIRLLTVLRRDPQSRLTADLFIAAASIGLIAATTRVVDVVVPSMAIPDMATWTTLSVAIMMAALTAGMSWKRTATKTVPAHPSLGDC